MRIRTTFRLEGSKRRSPRELGLEMETLACYYLEQQGYSVACRNFASKYGEIDIVALEGRTLVFVEVRYRRQGSLVGPEESLDARKKNKIRLAIRDFLASYNTVTSYDGIRVDLCAVSGLPPKLTFKVLKGIIDFAN